MEKEKIYIDLGKCTEEQRKEIARIINKHGHSITSKANYEIINGCYDELFPLLTYHEYWYCSRYASDKTELTYPEFIKLFEGGEGENETSLQIAIKALENIINPIGYMKSQLEEGDTLNGHYAIMLTEKPQFYQNIAEEALRKINSNQ